MKRRSTKAFPTRYNFYASVQPSDKTSQLTGSVLRRHRAAHRIAYDDVSGGIRTDRFTALANYKPCTVRLRGWVGTKKFERRLCLNFIAYVISSLNGCNHSVQHLWTSQRVFKKLKLKFIFIHQ
jgi:hypothetical protein